MTVNQHESVARYVRYARHVTELAAAFGVALYVRAAMRPEEAFAGFTKEGDRPVVVIAPVTDESTYAVALHELGHSQHPLGRVHHVEGSRSMRTANQPGTVRDVKLKLLAEESAWEWAHQYALEWTPAMESVETLSLGSYRATARKFGVKA